MARFAELAGIDYRSLKNFLIRPVPEDGENITPRRAQRIKEYSDLLDKINNPDGIGKLITDAERLQLYIDITEAEGSVQAFCNKHPEWPYDFVNNIVSQNLSDDYKRITTKSQRVADLIDFVSKNY